MNLHGGAFAQGLFQRQNFRQSQRLKMSEAFARFKRDNPEASAADFQSFVQQASGNDYFARGALPSDEQLQSLGQRGDRERQQRLSSERSARRLTRSKLHDVGMESAGKSLFFHDTPEPWIQSQLDKNDESYAEDLAQMREEFTPDKWSSMTESARDDLYYERYPIDMQRMRTAIDASGGQLPPDFLNQFVDQNYSPANKKASMALYKTMQAKAQGDYARTEQDRSRNLAMENVKVSSSIVDSILASRQAQAFTKGANILTSAHTELFRSMVRNKVRQYGDLYDLDEEELVSQVLNGIQQETQFYGGLKREESDKLEHTRNREATADQQTAEMHKLKLEQAEQSERTLLFNQAAKAAEQGRAEEAHEMAMRSLGLKEQAIVNKMSTSVGKSVLTDPAILAYIASGQPMNEAVIAHVQSTVDKGARGLDYLDINAEYKNAIAAVQIMTQSQGRAMGRASYDTRTTAATTRDAALFAGMTTADAGETIAQGVLADIIWAQGNLRGGDAYTAAGIMGQYVSDVEKDDQDRGELRMLLQQEGIQLGETQAPQGYRQAPQAPISQPFETVVQGYADGLSQMIQSANAQFTELAEQVKSVKNGGTVGDITRVIGVVKIEARNTVDVLRARIGEVQSRFTKVRNAPAAYPGYNEGMKDELLYLLRKQVANAKGLESEAASMIAELQSRLTEMQATEKAKAPVAPVSSGLKTNPDYNFMP